uniref:DUF4187 domain-containing protein n=1 Tax=Leersia perrieri TaxID=77586 RepID=A0A0D9X9M0_9ORYZ
MEPDAGDDEDDYMGDLSHFLPPPPSSSQSTTLGRRKLPPPPPPSQGRGHGQPKRAKGRVPWQERRRRDRERKQREEDERTMAGLAEAIPESNLGFRMLRQMGYNPSAAVEPVGIEIRRSRAGIGAEPAVSAAVVAVAKSSPEVAEAERRRVEEMAVELRARQSTQWRSRRVVWDYRKAEAALAQLENREVAPPQPPPEGEEEKGEEEEEEVITEEDLQNILAKLRDEHYYCLYCGCKDMRINFQCISMLEW